MKILLDECVTKRLKKHLTNFEVFTVRELGLSGIKNGKLMTYCTDNSFNILLTVDKNLMFQQNLENYPVTIITRWRSYFLKKWDKRCYAVVLVSD